MARKGRREPAHLPTLPGHEFAALRKFCGLDKGKAARALGVDRSTLHRWEQSGSTGAPAMAVGALLWTAFGHPDALARLLAQAAPQRDLSDET